MLLEIPLKKITKRDIIELEKKRLIKRLIPPEEYLNVPEGEFKGCPIYKTESQYGGHMLLFVNMNLLNSNLNYHPGNEDVFLINDGGDVKPCIFVFGLGKKDEIEKKIETKTLSESDFLAFDIPFNQPALSFFTIYSETPHYEITLPGPKQSPYFWVGESSDLPLIKINMDNYELKIKDTC